MTNESSIPFASGDGLAPARRAGSGEHQGSRIKHLVTTPNAQRRTSNAETQTLNIGQLAVGVFTRSDEPMNQLPSNG